MGAPTDIRNTVALQTYVGYNYTMSQNVAVGAEFNVGTSPFATSGMLLSLGVGYKLTEMLDAALRARVGYTFDQNLIYGFAGPALMVARAQYSGIGSATRTHYGVVVDAGFERQITQNVAARVEVSYATYGARTYKAGGLSVSNKFDDARVMGSLTYRF